MSEHLLHFFGPGTVTAANGQPIAMRSRRQLALLAYLATEHAIAHSRETLMALLWPEEEMAAAQNNLRVTLSRLRETAEKLSPGDSSLPELLLIDRHTVQLHSAWVAAADVNGFNRLLEETRQHEHASRSQCASCQPLLRKAVDLFQYEFLAGFGLGDCLAFEEWLYMQRERLRLLLLEAYADLAAFAENNGDLSEASTFAQRQIDLDSLRESAYRQQMRIFAKQGNRNGALTLFERCRTVLSDELGLDPEPESLALHLQLLNDHFSIAPENLPANSPPRRSNLPLQLTPFIGRERELAQLQERLAHPTYRLLSIVGPGGIGKSRLAQQVAAQQIAAFRDGVYFVELAKVTASASIPATIVETLGWAFEASPETPDMQLSRMIGDKQMLLVLDNFEHLMDGATLLLDLLHHSPQLVVLVTSREGLNLQSEDLFELQGLPTPTQSNNGQIGDFAALRLFVERARRLNKEFQLDKEQLPHIVRICQLVEGLPLAIELAATWLRDLTCAEIVAELAAGLDRLESTQRDVVPEHRSLRAVFVSSWRLLSPDEQRVLAQLSVFRGGFALDAARALSNASPTLLSGLRNKSLLRHAGARRYDMHALVQQFAAEALAGDPQMALQVQSNHAHYFLDLLAAQAIVLDTAQARQAADKIQPDWENVAAAWQRASQQGELDRLQRALDGLVRFCNLRGLFQEAQRLLEQSITHLAALPQTIQIDALHLLLYCQLLTALAYFAGRRGLGHTRQLAAEALALAEMLDSNAEIISNLVTQAGACEVAADFTQATELAERALQLAQDADLELQAGLCFDLLGIVALETEQFARAQEYFQQVLAIHERTGRLEQRSRAAIGFLGSIAAERGHFDVALQYNQRYLASCEAMGDLRNIAHAKQSLAYLWLRLGGYETSIALATQSAAQARAIGDREICSLALHTKAWAHRHLAQLPEALICASEAVALARDLKAMLALAYALVQLSQAELASAQTASVWADAAAHFQEAGAIFHSLGKEIMGYEVTLGLAELARCRGDLVTARALVEPILPMLPTQSADSWDEPIRACVICVRILHANNDPDFVKLLEQGLHLLDHLAQKISDVSLRHNFMTMVPAHRELPALRTLVWMV